MLVWTGKVVGALLGYLFAGPIGAVAGLIIGQYFDIARSSHVRPMGRSTQQNAQQVFFKATFSVMGHIAKADGRVSEVEIRAARAAMRNMMLSESMKKEAIRYFTLGKSPNFRIDDAIGLLLRYCGRQRNLLRLFLEIQFQAANADGFLGPNKRKILEFLCLRLGFNINEFVYFSKAGYRGDQGYGRSRTQRRTTSLDEAYTLLGVSKNASDAEVKRAYRKQMSRNHPDKLVSKGLPEEMIKIATEKTQKIKKAYEQIKNARGIK